MTKEIYVPDIGEYSDVDVIEVAVNVGDQVDVEDTLISLETDKATMDIPAPAAGKVKELRIKVGDKVSQGALILLLDTVNDEITKDGENKIIEAESDDNLSATNITKTIIPIVVPDIGTEDKVDIIEVAVAVNDNIDKDDTLITLESDKASMDIPATEQGLLVELLVKVGDKVLYGKYSGTEISVEDDEFLIMRESDIFGVLA